MSPNEQKKLQNFETTSFFPNQRLMMQSVFNFSKKIEKKNEDEKEKKEQDCLKIFSLKKN